MKCPNCGGQNPNYRRKCQYCGTYLDRPALSSAVESLRNQLLAMSLSSEDLYTVCFALGIDWHELEQDLDEAGLTDMLARMLDNHGRIDEASHFLHDFRFPQGYPPLATPYADNVWLTYVFACQNVTTAEQLAKLCEEAELGDAHNLPGQSLPHKLREVFRVAQRHDRMVPVYEWLAKLEPQQGLQRSRRRRQRR